MPWLGRRRIGAVHSVVVSRLLAGFAASRITDAKSTVLIHGDEGPCAADRKVRQDERGAACDKAGGSRQSSW